MNVVIVTPAAKTTHGNSITAKRWSRLLRELGHGVDIQLEWNREPCDILIALHARRSSESINRFHHAFPDRPLIVALTGTDVYCDLHEDESARRSLALASHIVTLQNLAAEELPPAERAKVRVIYQSAIAPKAQTPSEERFQVCVLSHLRDVKDPLRAAWAAALLPETSRIQILHAGQPLEPQWREAAIEEERVNPRYRWLSEMQHDQAIRLLSRSRLLIVSSMVEGGANAISEAVVCGVPVLCTRIAGNTGMLGREYPGYFGVKATAELANLLNRAETDAEFLASLKSWVERLKPVFSPESERKAWAQLLAEIQEH